VPGGRAPGGPGAKVRRETTGKVRAKLAVQQNRMVVLSGVTVVLAIIVLTGAVVFRLGTAAAVGTLTALAAVLATVPQIIKAVQGRGR
jgi:hypothetical protein